MTTMSVSLILMIFFLIVSNHHKVMSCSSVTRDTVGSCAGKPCHNGECMFTRYGPLVFEICLCDAGWGGPFCDKCLVVSPPVLPEDNTEATLVPEDVMAISRSPSVSLPFLVPSYDDCKSPKRTDSKRCGRRGLRCQNGDCKEEIFDNGPFPIRITKCGDPCDAGWTGSNCDICCDLKCPAGSNCVIENWTMNCRPSSSFLPKNAATPSLKNIESLNLTEVYDQLTTEVSVVSTDRRCNAEERRVPTWCNTRNCYNGNCTTYNDTFPTDGNVSSNNYPFQPHCTCDPGWMGEYCDQCCDLDCNNGTCDLDHGQMFCNCYRGYRGNDCSDLAPTTTPSTIGKRVSDNIIY